MEDSMTKFHEITSGWEKQMGSTPDKLNESLELLVKLFNNIGSNPLDQKYRKIKTTNPTIKEKVFRLQNVDQLLTLVGFTHQVEGSDDLYVLEDKNLGTLLPFIQELRNRIALVEALQVSQDEYQRVLSVVSRQNKLHQQQVEDKKKEDQIREQLKYDQQERKYIEVKDSIAVNMNQKRQASPLQHISGDQDFNTKVIQSEKPVIVDFYADWCPPCKKLAALLESELDNSKGWIVAKINCDDSNNASLKQKHGVSGIPAIFLYHKGQLIKEHSFTGFNPGALNNAIQKAVQLGKQ